MLAPPLGSWRPLLGEILDPPLNIILHLMRSYQISNQNPEQLRNNLTTTLFDYPENRKQESENVCDLFTSVRD